MSAVPPWENGALLPEAKRVLDEQDEGALMGGPRFEQLSRATGTARIGDASTRIDGGALRVRRQGIRRLGTFRGHAWQSALFPERDGASATSSIRPATMVCPPTTRATSSMATASSIPAWVVEAPWLRRLQPKDEDVSVVLETATARPGSRAGRSCRTSWSWAASGPNPDFPVLQQAIVRYTWDGETANGMMERSTRGDQIERSMTGDRRCSAAPSRLASTRSSTSQGGDGLDGLRRRYLA